MDKHRQELINQCRYYKGEEENPYKDGDRSLYWFYELKWVQFMMEQSDFLQKCVDMYKSAGGTDIAGIPSSLTAVLFNRFCYGGYSEPSSVVEKFREFIKKTYLVTGM